MYHHVISMVLQTERITSCCVFVVFGLVGCVLVVVVVVVVCCWVVLVLLLVHNLMVVVLVCMCSS